MNPLAVNPGIAGVGLDEAFQPLDREIQGFSGHVGEAYPEPAGFGAVTGRPGRDIQPDVVNNLFPKIHLCVKSFGAQEVAHVHPAEQPGVAFQAADSSCLKAGYQHLLLLLEPFFVLDDVVFTKLLVGEHFRQKILRL